MDEPDFEAELHQLISTATEEGIQVAGAYPVRFSHAERQNYEVIITEISNAAD